MEGGSSFARIDEALRRARDVEELTSRVAELTTELFAVDHATLYLVDLKRELLWRGDEVEWSTDRGLCGHVARTGIAVVVRGGALDLRHDVQVDGARPTKEQSVSVDPVRGPDGAIDAIMLLVWRVGDPADDAAAVRAQLCHGIGYHLARVTADLARYEETTAGAAVYRPEAIEAFVRRGHDGVLVVRASRRLRYALGAALFATCFAIWLLARISFPLTYRTMGVATRAGVLRSAVFPFDQLFTIRPGQALEFRTAGTTLHAHVNRIELSWSGRLAVSSTLPPIAEDMLAGTVEVAVGDQTLLRSLVGAW